MTRKFYHLGLVLSALVGLVACAEEHTADQAPAAPAALDTSNADAVASLTGRDGSTIGSAWFRRGTKGVVMRIAVAGLAPGAHGMHFHTIGTCADPADGFKATGGHIMPDNKPHGFFHPEGPHEGNLPNLLVSEDGTAHVELYTELVSVNEGPAALLDADGSTLIIHENEDDHLTQPIGGAGARVACGLIRRP